jgi:hypothetical protein
LIEQKTRREPPSTSFHAIELGTPKWQPHSLLWDCTNVEVNWRVFFEGTGFS